MGCQPTIHVNPSLAHQKKLGTALADGFRRCGLEPVLTTDPRARGDFHVVLGPWFALKEWRMGRTLYIDRAYWDDPDCVSVHWLSDGEKVRTRGNPYRSHPELAPMKSGDRRVYLCDYGQEPVGNYHAVRYHPAHKPSRYSLKECLDAHDIAIGRRTTALVDAHIRGLRVETDDPHSPVWGVTDREQWITDLAWHNWSHDEISRGEMWNHIQSR
jgi:hypothetical protein